jgi:hypothetical protein
VASRHIPVLGRCLWRKPRVDSIYRDAYEQRHVQPTEAMLVHDLVESQGNGIGGFKHWLNPIRQEHICHVSGVVRRVDCLDQWPENPPSEDMIPAVAGAFKSILGELVMSIANHLCAMLRRLGCSPTVSLVLRRVARMYRRTVILSSRTYSALAWASNSSALAVNWLYRSRCISGPIDPSAS